ncbi:MFS general substrate transporter [Microthyrium microscopicum]|uniref:MFS general substrate transporter n=1 Tax=Microthyrium microscopicum TaxID=703497 RepID=A0A6A6U9U3_9PEZI|nr:MFS general substrate transporter [Microthyrium microscopicum]
MAHGPDDKTGGVSYDNYHTDSNNDIDGPEFTPAEEKKIWRRVDLRLVVLIGFMYCVSLMDRANLSNAKVAGMESDPRDPKFKHEQGLNLIGFRYNIMSLVFFPPYIIFQIPSTVIVRALGPRLHLGTITLLWGSVMVAMAFVNDWQVMAGMRVLLGILEAGFFPSCVYLLSTWYTRYEMGKRYSLFYILGCVASAFAGLLAYGIMSLQGKANMAAWRWIFLTIFMALLGYALIVGFPDQWKPSWHFLSEREVKYVLSKVNEDRGDAVVEPFSMGVYLRSALDWKIWCYAMIFFNNTTVTYGLAYFLPDILRKSLHYDQKMSQIMGAPPYIAAGVVMYLTGWIGDKYQIRGPIIIFNMILSLIGIPLLGWTTNGSVRYFGIFLLAAGVNANIPVTMTYQANNIRGQWKRAFCSATLVGFGGIGGIAGSLVFRAQDAPAYKPGLFACMACCILNIVIVTILTLNFTKRNRDARAGKKFIEGADDGFLYTI